MNQISWDDFLDIAGLVLGLAFTVLLFKVFA